ncbi:MAG: efflux RND transporter permease subunit [Actinomycetota bacterium]
MMRWIVGSSLKFRRLIVAIAGALVVVGFLQLDDMKTDALPEFSRPTVEVQTEALGLSAEEVEQLITVPLEQDLLNGIAFLDEIESASIPGLSSVVMTFEPGTPLLDARQVVAERLTQAVAAAGLPQVAKPPQMLQPLSSLSRVAIVKLESDELTPIETSVLARWIIVPRLLGVEGVANVAIWGFRDRQLQVLVDPQVLADNDVTLSQVIRTAGNALEVSPLSFLEASSPGTGGFIDTVNQRLHVFHEQAISTPRELAQVPLEGGQGSGAGVNAGGTGLVLGDVAEVVEDHQPLIGDALCGDGTCTLLVIEKFPEANTPEVTAGIDGAFEELGPGLPGLQVDTSVYRPATYIENSLDNLGRALVIGGILVLLIFGAFFFEWRSAAIAGVSTVASLTAGWLVLHLTDTTVNTMILAGIVMALVVLIDDAIVDVDTIARRMREHQEVGDGLPTWRVILDASLEMRRPLLYATIIAAAAIVPAFFMEGEAGAFLPAIASTYLLAILAAMLVALILTPALALLLLQNRFSRAEASAPIRWLQRTYDRITAKILPRPGVAYATFGLVAVIGVVTIPFLDLSLRPALSERDVIVSLQAPPGTSLTRMDEITAQAVGEIGALPGINAVGAHVGRAIQSDQVVNVNAAEVWINIDAAADYDATLAAIRGVAGGLPDADTDVFTYSEQRITEVLGRKDAEIMVRVYGEDPDVLEDTAEAVRESIAGIDGVVDPQVRRSADEATIEVEADIAQAERFGISPGDVRRSATTLLSGLVVGNLFEEQKVFDVVVWGTPELRQTKDDVRNLLIDTPRGGLVPLSSVADVRLVPNPTVILHESVQTYVDVTASVSGRGVAAVAADVDTAIASMAFPLEYHAELLGGFAEEAAAQSRVLVIALTVLIAIFLLLQAALYSWRVAAVVLMTLPMSLTGGAVAALVTGGDITLGSGAGCAVLLALAARTSTTTVRRYLALEREHGGTFGADLVASGTRERLGAVAMTTLAAAAVLAPIVVAGHVAGFEIVRPMAVVVLGGLVTSVLLSVVVLPAAYLRFGYIAEPDTSADELFIRIPDVDTIEA